MERERLSSEKKQRREPAIASLGPTAAASAPAKDAGKDKPKRKAPSKDAKDEPFTAIAPGGKKP
jgi:hypothetical protein